MEGESPCYFSAPNRQSRAETWAIQMIRLALATAQTLDPSRFHLREFTLAGQTRRERSYCTVASDAA